MEEKSKNEWLRRFKREKGRCHCRKERQLPSCIPKEVERNMGMAASLLQSFVEEINIESVCVARHASLIESVKVAVTQGEK